MPAGRGGASARCRWRGAAVAWLRDFWRVSSPRFTAPPPPP